MRDELHAGDISQQLPEMIFQYQRKPDGIGRFLYVSPSAHKIFGYPARLIINNEKLAWNAVHPDDAEKLRQRLDASAEAMADFRWEGRVIDRQNYQLQWITASARPKAGPDGAVIWNGVMHDVSRLKQDHIEMKHASEKAEENAQIREDALAVLSHELRTPLNGILGVVQLMEMDARPDQTEYLRLMKGSAENLMGMINNILDNSKLNAGKMKIGNQEIHLQQFMQFLRSTHAARAEQKQIQLLFNVEKAMPKGFKSDEMVLNQILNNLIGNAVKFTNNGKVELEIQPLQEFPQQLLTRFAVKDTGPGISETDQQTIFEKYAQAESAQNHIGGTGLGLSLCQRFLTLLGSELRVKSKVGEGSQFYFDLVVDKV